MKKLLGFIVFLVVAGAVAFVLLPKEFSLIIPKSEIQQKAQQKFPQIKGKSITVLPEGPKLPRLPKLPKLPNLPKPPLPKLEAKNLVMLITLSSPQLELTEGKIFFGFDMDICFTGGNKGKLAISDKLPINREYQTLEGELYGRLTEICGVSDQAKIRMSGKDTWMVEDGDSEYFLVKEPEQVEIFQTKEQGSETLRIKTKAKAKVSGELNFKEELKTVFFENVKVEKLQLEQLPPNSVLPVKILQNKMAEQITSKLQEEQIAVINLNETAQEKPPILVRILGRQFLKDIQVRQDCIEVVLSIKK